MIKMGIIRSKIVVEGNKGSKEVMAIVDTGASYSGIPQDLAQEIGVEKVMELDVPVPPNGEIKKIPLGIGKVKIGMCKRPTILYILGERTNVLLGQPELQLFGATVDYEKERVTVKKDCSPMLGMMPDSRHSRGINMEVIQK